MKKLLFLASLSLMLAGMPAEIVSHNHASQSAHIHAPQPSAAHARATPAATVYICTGEYAKSYHSDRDCAAGSCKASVKAITQAEAERIGRMACRKCVD